MGNIFATLPLPVLNGPGAAVATDGMGIPKTIIVTGSFDNTTITVEASVDGGITWAPIALFRTGDTQIQAIFTANFMRTNVNGRNAIVPFSANVEVGAPNEVGNFADILIPATVGAGVAVDVNEFGVVSTFIAGGDFSGAAVRVEISDDNVNWAPLLTFSGQGGIKTVDVTARFVRAFVSGHPVSGTLAMGSSDVAGEDDNIPAPPYPATPPVIVTVYARPTGDDTLGNGSLVTPYRTFQRAIRDVPHLIPGGYIYNVDITDIGVETLPPGYQFPAIAAPLAQVTPAAFGGSIPAPFELGSSFNVRAFPQPASNIPLADTIIAIADIVSITAAPGTDLAIVTIAAPRASWAADSLKGKFLVVDQNGLSSCVIYASDATTISLCVRSNLAPGFAMAIMETSATLECEYTEASGEAAVDIRNCPQIALQGITFRPTGPAVPGPAALAWSTGVLPFFVMCVFEGGVSCSLVEMNFICRACVITGFVGADGGAFTSNNCLILDAFIFIANPGGTVWVNTVLDGCFAISSPVVYTSRGNFPPCGTAIRRCLMVNGLDPEGGVFVLNGGTYHFQHVQIDNPSGPGITVEGGAACAILEDVTGTNLDYGVLVHDGGIVRVLDDATLITGGTADMKVGTLPARSWADFRTALPGPAASGRGIKNEHDLNMPITGTGDSFAVAGGVVTMTDAAAAFTPTMAGQLLAIAGSTSPANDGVFVVATYVDASNITFANPNAVAEVFPGTWKVLSTYAQGDEVTGVDTGGRSGSRLYQRPTP